MRFRVRSLWIAAAVLVAVAGGATASAAVGGGGDAVPTVVRGVVVTVDAAGGLMLADGTWVEIAGDPGWADDRSGVPPRPGDEVVVIGKAESRGSGLVVRAAAVRRAGRRATSSEDVCAQSKRTAGVPGDVLPDPMVAPVVPAGLKGDTQVEGTVDAVDGSGFDLAATGIGVLRVEVDGDTELIGFDAVAALHPGDAVRARGDLQGAVLYSTRVELKSGGGGDDNGGGDGGSDDGGGVDYRSTGRLVELRPPDRFALDDGLVYRVDANTRYDEDLVSYAGLATGQFLDIEADYLGGGDYLVDKVELEGDEDDGQGYREVSGTVAAVSAASVALAGGPTVLITASTDFDGDGDRVGDLQVGWEVEILALENRVGELLAQRIRSRDPGPPTTVDQEFEPGEALVILADGADAEVVAGRHGAQVAGLAGPIGVLFRWDDELEDELLQEMAADPEILAVEPNYRFRDPESTRRRFPVVDRNPSQDRFRNQAGTGQVKLAGALQLGTGAGTVVAVVDTGVDPCHPLLMGHLLPGGLDLVDGDLSPWERRNGVDDDGDGDVDEAAGHGSFVASIVALGAPSARILPYRVLDDDGGGSAYDVALAVADALGRGVDVINLSLLYRERSTVVDLLLEEAAARGVIVVAAAGNDPDAPLGFPAVDSHVLAVSAFDADAANLAEFAGRGDAVRLAAPGVDVYGALDDGQFGTWSGTSMAAPWAAAGAALVKELDPQATAPIVRQLLVQAGFVLPGGPATVQGLDLAAATALVAP